MLPFRQRPVPDAKMEIHKSALANQNFDQGQGFAVHPGITSGCRISIQKNGKLQPVICVSLLGERLYRSKPP